MLDQSLRTIQTSAIDGSKAGAKAKKIF